MSKLVISLDGVVIKEVPLTKDKTTLGRRPYNDIVIDNLAVSGEHAVLEVVGAEVFIEDLHSTNGTYVNGKPIKRQTLRHNDTVEVGKYKLKFVVEDTGEHEKTAVVRPVAPPGAFHPTSMPTVLDSDFGAGGVGQTAGPAAAGLARIRVLDGPAAGREITLTKAVTTVGKPGVQVASIARRPDGCAFAHVEGVQRPRINGRPLTEESTLLRDGDVIELAGTRMQFIQR